MKRALACCAVIVLCLASVSTGAEMTGKQVLEEQKERHKVDTEQSTDVMLLKDKRDRKEKRTMKRYAKEDDKGNSKSLVVFTEPANIKGTAVLTWNHEDGSADQWLYLPALKKMQRIAEGSKKSYFMGTDITYEDMEPEDTDNYDYNIVRTETLDDQECWVIEAVPNNDKKRKESGYSKRMLWIRKDIFFTVKIEFYDRRERHIKTQTIGRLEHIEGTLWRARRTLTDNHKRKHMTVAGVKEDILNEPIDDKLFTERHVSSGRHVR